MADFFIVSCLVLLTFLDCMLVDLEKTAKSNAAECSKLEQTECERVGACIWESEACSQDPCYARKVTGACSTNCQKITVDSINSFCVTSSRADSFASIPAKCSLEWGDTKLLEEGFCHTMTGCDTVSPLNVTDSEDIKYYVCNEKPPVTDTCNVLSEEICPYIGKCMWEGGQCVADPCWEKVYTSTDSCGSSSTTCERKLITGSGVSELGYCKSPSHDLHDMCNAGTGSNFITKQVACTGYPPQCKEIVTINNYEGGTLYVCSTAAGEFTVEKSASVSLNSFAVAVSALMILVLLF